MAGARMLWAVLALAGTQAVAQTAGAPGASGARGARYVESCQQAVESGVVPAGCQGPLYASEIERLKEDALRTQNAGLLTLLGDAYQSQRSGLSDIGQAYRWYLLAAVRGDPRAMQRLGELYQDGRGAPQDRVKALGYARLAQRLAGPGGATAQRAAASIGRLGSDMAAEEIVLAERFASELERHLQVRGPAPAGPAPASAGAVDGTPSVRSTTSPVLPGLGAAQVQGVPATGLTLP